jgi:hypothetical protein
MPESLTIRGEVEKLGIGDAIYWRAVAQEKPALRKAVMADIADARGTYSVRYISGGVRLERLA